MQTVVFFGFASPTVGFKARFSQAAVDALRVVYDDKAVVWTSDFFGKYVGKTFKRVHLERGVVWLYFENVDTLLTGVATYVAERETPILKLSDED